MRAASNAAGLAASGNARLSWSGSVHTTENHRGGCAADAGVESPGFVPLRTPGAVRDRHRAQRYGGEIGAGGKGRSARFLRDGARKRVLAGELPHPGVFPGRALEPRAPAGAQIVAAPPGNRKTGGKGPAERAGAGGPAPVYEG